MESEIEEANSQYIAFRRTSIKSLPGSDTRDEPGLSYAWADTPIRTRNSIFLSGPVRGEADFQDRAHRAIHYMRTRKCAGMLWICREWLPPGTRPQDFALEPVVTATAMAADGLAAATRPLPRGEYYRVTDEQGCAHVADINASAWGFSIELGRTALGITTLLNADVHGCLAYVNRTPVACCATYVQDRRLYVALVATIPEMQGRGYGEAVTRLSMASAAKASGYTRSLLHATPAGLPTYRKLGYRVIGLVTAYTHAL